MRWTALFSSETTKTFLMYLAIGMAFLPWGMLYALISLSGWDHWSLVVLLLGAGLLTSHFVWAALQTPKASTPTQIINESQCTKDKTYTSFIMAVAASSGVVAALSVLMVIILRKKEEAIDEYLVCPSCGNTKSGDTIYRCSKCSYIYCLSCAKGSRGMRCPTCNYRPLAVIGLNLLGKIK